VTAPAIGGESDITFTGTVQILPDTTLTIAGTSPLRVVTFEGPLFGPGGLSKPGSGRLILSGNNTYEGGTDLQEGFLTVRNDNALGQGLLKLSGGALDKDESQVTLPNRFEVSTGRIDCTEGVFAFTGAGTLLAGGRLTVNASVEGSVIFSGAVGGE